MKPFQFNIHYRTDPYTGKITYPDELRLVAGNTVMASIPMQELMLSLEELKSYYYTPNQPE